MRQLMGMRSFLVAVVIALGVGAGLAFLIDRPGLGRSRAAPVISEGEAAIGGPFELTDQAGRTVTDRDFRGRYLLVYFGFTYCPDVCPTELQAISVALERLGQLGKNVQPLFVTVDPERDTTAVLARYLKHFDPRILGLTGRSTQIAKAIKAYRVYAAKDTRDAGAAGYVINHSTAIYFMDTDGHYIAHFNYGTTPQDMAARMADHLKRATQASLETR
jgi:protein SCO1/2